MDESFIDLHDPQKEKAPYKEYLTKVLNHTVTEEDLKLAQSCGWKLPELEGTDIEYERDGQDWLDAANQFIRENEIQKIMSDERWRNQQQAILRSTKNNYRFLNLTPEEEKAKYKELIAKHSKLPPLDPIPLDRGDCFKEMQAWKAVCDVEETKEKLDEFNEMMALAGVVNKENLGTTQEKQKANLSSLLVIYLNSKDGSVDDFKKHHADVLDRLPKNVGVLYFPTQYAPSRIEVCNF